MEKKFKKIKGNIKYAYGIAGTAVLVVLCFVIFSSLKNNSVQYVVQNGTIENTELVTAYVVKSEKVIEKDSSKVIIPIVSDKSRVSIGNIIATYKEKGYEEYILEIEKMDKEILELMQDLPTVYSSEIENIEKQIYELIKKSNNETSYIKMQEYKTDINTLINKRAELIGNLSPEGAKIKELIKKRNSYEESAKKLNNNIVAKTPGIVSYETDSLEEMIDLKDIETLTFEKILNYCKSIQVDNTKIKIVNNYEAYIIAEVSKQNAEYMKIDKQYSIKLVGDNSYIFDAIMYKITENAENYEVVFKISNGIEYLVNEREILTEIIWWENTGLFIINDAIYPYENLENVYYVKVIKYGQYTDIPIKIIKRNNKYCIVQNYTKDEMKKLSLTREYTLKIYDRLIVESDKGKGV